MQGLCREGNAGCVPVVALAGPLHPVTVPGPAVSAAVTRGQLHFQSARGVTHGTPKRFTNKSPLVVLMFSSTSSTSIAIRVLEFIVETGGRINAAGLQFLSRILPLEAEGTAGLTRRHGRGALRGISRALALQQGYMLAQITEDTRLIVLLKIPRYGGGGQQRVSGPGSS